jgi:hypothetical protein
MANYHLGHVSNWHSPGRAASLQTVMGVPVKYAIAFGRVDRFSQEVTSKKWINLPLFAQKRALDRCKMQKREAVVRIERAQPGFKNLGLHTCVMSKSLHFRLSELGHAGSGKSPTKPLKPDNTDALPPNRIRGGIPLEHRQTAISQELSNSPVLARMKIMVSQNQNHRHPHPLKVVRERLRFLDSTVLGKIASDQKDIRTMGDGLKAGTQAVTRASIVVNVPDRSDPDHVIVSPSAGSLTSNTLI